MTVSITPTQDKKHFQHYCYVRTSPELLASMHTSTKHQLHLVVNRRKVWKRPSWLKKLSSLDNSFESPMDSFLFRKVKAPRMELLG
ncbi:hypothetical protein AAFF_G00007420 [Aldrovandia affinis]|uniref:Uncharacterized protein n=1 Tax=Aldrovandia affinis TaxID=143900 RepID=A0AAD7T5Z5_9TELE|nr:hypothetical protein AAFF_G00007420 [Aldrovandia affinis]